MLSLIFFTFGAFASGWTSSGGNSVVCFNSKQEIMSAELFDFYENKVLNGWNIEKNESLGYLQQAKEIIKRAENLNLGTFSQDTLDFVVSQLKFLPPGAQLQPINDSDSPILPPKNCQMVQTALYRNDGSILINSDVWNHLSETDRAGLVMHEVVYLVLRQRGEKNSIRTRKFVGALFSNQNMVSVGVPYLSGRTIEHCHTGRTENNPINTPMTAFEIFKKPNGDLKITFLYINGVYMVDGLELTAKDTAGFPISSRPEGEVDPTSYKLNTSIVSKSIIDDYMEVEMVIPEISNKDFYLDIKDPVHGSSSVLASCQAYVTGRTDSHLN